MRRSHEKEMMDFPDNPKEVLVENCAICGSSIATSADIGV